MRISFKRIVFTTLSLLGLAYYFAPFMRYLFDPFNGSSKAPDTLMMRFLDSNTACDAQNSTINEINTKDSQNNSSE